MAAVVEIDYQSSIEVNASLAKTYAYLSRVDQSLPTNFPGLQSFKSVGDQAFEWVFEKIGHSGYDIQIKLITKFTSTPETKIQATPQVREGYGNFSGTWNLTAKGSSTKIDFEGRLEIELPIPSFLKVMAGSLAKKELSKLFDRYLSNVAKNLSE